MVKGPVPITSEGSVSISQVEVKVPSSTWLSSMCLGYMAVPIERRKVANGTGRTHSTVYSSTALTVMGASSHSPVSSFRNRKWKVARLLAGMSGL